MKASELITNPDGSIYHLRLLPEDVAPTVILVGDPGRVATVSAKFSSIDVKKEKREFITHTGWYAEKRITVISTGIGTDNIDIVLNELDALVNINLKTRTLCDHHTTLNLVRIGTSGSIHPNVHADQIVVSEMAAGMDILGMFYPHQKLGLALLPEWTYLTSRYPFDLSAFPEEFAKGITLTSPGFYGPQGRSLRLRPALDVPTDVLYQQEINGIPFTNIEMETSAIYLLSDLLGHRAISFNGILANRMKGEFSARPAAVVDKLIVAALHWIAETT